MGKEDKEAGELDWESLDWVFDLAANMVGAHGPNAPEIERESLREMRDALLKALSHLPRVKAEWLNKKLEAITGERVSRIDALDFVAAKNELGTLESFESKWQPRVRGRPKGSKNKPKDGARKEGVK